MRISQPHNSTGEPAAEKPFGIRVSLRPGDPFAALVGSDWQQTHWFATERERDAALEDMSRRHLYSRQGDAPALAFAKIARLAASRRR